MSNKTSNITKSDVIVTRQLTRNFIKKKKKLNFEGFYVMSFFFALGRTNNVFVSDVSMFRKEEAKPFFELTIISPSFLLIFSMQKTPC